MDQVDKRRRTKVEVRSMPPPVEWILKNATGEQLEYLSRMSSSSDFKTFANLIGRFKEYNVYEVFRYIAKDENDLALFRASKRGEIAGLDALLLAAQMASDGIKRRKKVKIS